MVLTPSRMIDLGTQLPCFSLQDPEGQVVSDKDIRSAPVKVIMVICNHCPYVKHLKTALAEFGREAQKQGVAVVAINPNNYEQYPEDHPDEMREDIARFGYTFPYLIDRQRQLADALQAVCTPEFYVFDQQNKLVYRGQFDDSRPGNNQPITGHDLRRAVALTLKGQPIDFEQKPSIGCNIKV